MGIRNKYRRILGWAVLLLLIIIGYFYVWPRVSSVIPRSLEARSRSLTVIAKYYPLDLDGDDSVYVANGKLFVKGFDLSLFLSTARRPPISRALPQEFSDIVVPDSSWSLMRSITNLQGFTPRKFVRSDRHDTVVVEFPAPTDEPRWAAYRNAGDTSLIVFSSSDWKRGAKVILGYIAAWRPK